MRRIAKRVTVWWHAVRSASPARLLYECALVVAVSALTAAGSIVLDGGPVLPAVLLAVGAAALVPLRLVYPTGALIAAAGLGTLGGGDTVLLFVLSVSAGYRMRTLPRAMLAFGTVLACALAGSWWHSGHDAQSLVFETTRFLVVDLLPAIVGQLVSQRGQLIEMMHERNVRLREQQAVVAEAARARERDRIARELHDSLGNRLTLMSMYAGALTNAAGPGADTALHLLRTTSATAMAELRQILGILRQADPADPTGEAPSLAGVGDLVEASRSAGTPVTLTREGDCTPLPPIVEHAAYRTIQEGLTNAMRHARGAPVRVTVRFEVDALIAEVVNGPGTPLDGPAGGQGLIGLAERIRLAGGVLYHGAQPDRGFRLAVTLPVTERAAAAQYPLAAAPSEAANDVTYHVRRSRRRSRMWVTAFTAGVFLVLGLGAAWLALVVRAETVSPATYQAIHLGQTERSVRAVLPPLSALATPSQGTPPAPSGTSCVDYYAGPALLFSDTHTVYRFCFRDGTLVSKGMYEDAGN